MQELVVLPPAPPPPKNPPPPPPPPSPFGIWQQASPLAQLAALVHPEIVVVPVGHWSALETQVFEAPPPPPPKPPPRIPGIVQHVCIGGKQKFPAAPQGTAFEGMLGAPSGFEPPLEPAVDPDELPD